MPKARSTAERGRLVGGQRDGEVPHSGVKAAELNKPEGGKRKYQYSEQGSSEEQ